MKCVVLLIIISALPDFLCIMCFSRLDGVLAGRAHRLFTYRYKYGTALRFCGRMVFEGNEVIAEVLSFSSQSGRTCDQASRMYSGPVCAMQVRVVRPS